MSLGRRGERAPGCIEVVVVVVGQPLVGGGGV